MIQSNLAQFGKRFVSPYRINQPLQMNPILRNKDLNKDTAFTVEEREKLHLMARLPHRVETLEEQINRCYKQVT